eukprot:NODE_29_length_37665_cov_1.081563.p13 type:complete len:329 gc:universal NODE_29_length_37665_cov_1.081563:19072-18086(-)
MDTKDQVAIHEAMEQQTISISKAGIQATLNARTSILAAANPVFGRYDSRKTLKQNVALTGPILSRFDLFFILKDDCDEATDIQLSQLIAKQHLQAGLLEKNQTPMESHKTPYTEDQMRNYIKFCRTIKPVLTSEAALFLSKAFKKLRMLQKADPNAMGDRITVRQMESMIRLSEALARLHGQNEVHVQFAKEAYRLVSSSTTQIKHEDVDIMIQNDAMDAIESVEQQVKKVKLTGSKFAKLKEQIILKFKSVSDDEPMMPRSDLIAYMMEEMEQEIQDADDLVELERILKAIIKHLVNKENVLIEDKMDEDGQLLEDPMVGLNPNVEF